MTNESHTQPNLQDLVRGHYEDNALPDATLERLMARPRTRANSVRRWVIAGAMATTLAVVALGRGTLGRGSLPSGGAANGAPRACVHVARAGHRDDRYATRPRRTGAWLCSTPEALGGTGRDVRPRASGGGPSYRQADDRQVDTPACANAR